MKKFCLVDDHSIVRTGVKLLLKEKFGMCEIDEATEGETAFQLIKNNDYDLVTMDLHMPNTDTMGLIENILRIKPATKILIFTMGAEELFARRFLKMGVKGFLNKECDDEELGKAIDLVLKNRKYMSEQLMIRITDDTLENKADNPFDDLSNREIEIVLLLAGGKSISEITDLLSIGNSTVGTHKARIFDKLKISNVIELRELAKLYQLIQ